MRISWYTVEHADMHKSADWFVALGIFAGGAAIASFMLHNIFFGILVVVAVGTLILVARRTPRQVRVQIADDALHMGPLVLPFESMKAFWVANEPAPVLHIKTDRVLRPYVSISLPAYRVEEVRTLLRERGVAEQVFQEPATDRVSNLLGLS